MLTVLLTRTSGRWDVAEDLWSSLIAELVERPESLNQVERLGPWLYRVGCRRAADWYRQQSSGGGVPNAELASVVPDASRLARELPPLESLLTGERQADVRQTLGQLSPADQEVLYLKYQHGWDYRRIAEYLGLTNLQVTHRLRRARNHLKAALLRSPLADDYAAAFHWAAKGHDL
jgi:RNA polymerase sigma factor (sigma-70 family)